MSTLLLILSLHIYVVANLNNYFFSSNTKDDSRTIVQVQSPVTSLKTITKLNSFFSDLTANKNELLKNNKSFYSNRIINASVNPIKKDIIYIETKTNPIIILLLNTRGSDLKYTL